MDSPLKESPSVTKMTSMIDVSQLDKVNAIPNKQADNVLMDGLCQDDQFYLNSLMDESSSNSDDDQEHAGPQRRPAWSPMVQNNPVKINKRLRKMRSSYAITMSLEDISYIRPSWGASKNIKRIELNSHKNNKKLKAADDVSPVKEAIKIKLEGDSKKTTKTSNAAYNCALFIVMIFIILLILSMQLVDNHKYETEIVEMKIQVDGKSKTMEIFKPTTVVGGPSGLIPLIKLRYGQGIPDNLKYQSCTCESFVEETKKVYSNSSATNMDIGDGGHCLTCLNWAMRANLQVFVSKEKIPREDHMAKLEDNDDEITMCYDVKWQSYDNLRTPLRDCFALGDGQWYGLGDVQSNSWPLNKLQFSSTPLVTNLSSEFNTDPIMARTTNSYAGGQQVHKQLMFGSYSKLALLNSDGVFIGNLKTDFQPSIETRHNPQTNSDEICLSVSCTDKCGQIWARMDRLDELKYQNNVMEYRICTNRNLKNLISRQFEPNDEYYVINNGRKRPTSMATTTTTTLSNSNNYQPAEVMMTAKNNIINQQNNLASPQSEKLVSTTEVESTKLDPATIVGNSSNLQVVDTTKLTTNSSGRTLSDVDSKMKRIPEGIGLIERTIFATSREFLPVLDGQTLRLYVDNIVKLGLKTSSIILVDTRWQTHVGSHKLNSALFPKPKLLFEILHNKGFKIVLTIKPYIDTSIGISNINQLLEMGRLYSARYKKNNHMIGRRPEEINSPVFGANLKPSSGGGDDDGYIIRRRSFFTFENETITTDRDSDTEQAPYMSRCKESAEGYCVLIDLTKQRNRQWLVEAVKKSSWLAQEADGIMIGGAHPDGFQWDDHYRQALAELVDTLFYKENLYILPQWSANFGYIQLAPRRCDWPGLQSILNSILNLSLMGIPLIHPGSVWGDLGKTTNVSGAVKMTPEANEMTQKFYETTSERQSDELNEELTMRWLQVSVFLPILQFNNIAPIEKYNLQDQLQNLVRLRKLYIVPEIKKNLPPTPLIIDSFKARVSTSANIRQQQQQQPQLLPVIRPIWLNQDLGKTMVGEQFSIGPDLLVAPILAEGQRQRDIYLPNGFWHDELRQTNIRGGKWLRNYPIELNEIAWFTRARR